MVLPLVCLTLPALYDFQWLQETFLKVWVAIDSPTQNTTLLYEPTWLALYSHIRGVVNPYSVMSYFTLSHVVL